MNNASPITNRVSQIKTGAAQRRGNGSVGARLTNNSQPNFAQTLRVSQEKPVGAFYVNPTSAETSRANGLKVVSQQPPLEMTPVRNTQPSVVVNLLYMEDFDPEVDPEFITKELRPYFSGVFADLALRSTQTQSNGSKTIDKVTFTEYINLPGIVSDRFHALASQFNSQGFV